MNVPSIDRRRLLELVDLYATDDIAPAEIAELEGLLRSAEEARQIFGRYIQFEVGLAQSIECSEAFQGLLTAMAGPAEPADVPATCALSPPRAARARGEFLVGAWTRVKVWLQKPEVLSVAVAALVLVAALFTLAVVYLPQRTPVGRPAIPAAAVAVARLTAVHNAEWAAGQTGVYPGARLPAGHRMELRQGLAEITYNTGARVTMEAPAAYVLSNDIAGSLEFGKIVAVVPAKAAGFGITTPTAAITDLGTEFGVSAKPMGPTQVLVFKGQVEVAAGSRSQRLTAGEGMLVAGEPGSARLQQRWDEELASSLKAARRSLSQRMASVAHWGPVGGFRCSATDLADANRGLSRIELAAGVADFGSDVAELVDGDIYGGEGSDLTVHSFTPQNGAVAIITFDTSIHTAGYDIYSIASLSGTFQSRAVHHYRVESRSVGGDFEPLFEIVESLPGNAAPQGAGEVRVVTRRRDEPLVTGIDALRITFHDVAGAEYPETMYREIDVFGEPATPATPSGGDPK